ncbi:Glycosyl transferase [Crateriforma conspicua]|uniref:Lipid-A-disaccharide synthase n=2 Tax=Crateriforma conspicua TaxID=2527996 RepID=A0A5C5YAA4_9PLAN|nr:Glycosyl transferase [Crateriforma conspicua]
MDMSRSIFFSVGEPSGDQHAARLADALRQADPSVHLRGFGGPAMAAAGCHLDLDLTRHAVVGLLEVLPKLRDFFRFADEAEQVFRDSSVDAVVLVDFPGFNWHIAKRAKRYGIPVYYYCPPQLWAWGGWRVAKMRRLVDHVLAVLPIEEDYFQTAGIPTTLVGHPFFDAVAEKPLDPMVMAGLRRIAKDDRGAVAVLPGSRSHEVHRNFPIQLAAIRRLHQMHPDAHFMVAAYRNDQCLWCRDQLSDSDRDLPIHFFVGATSEIIQFSRCAMMVSGSVSLELMARQTPAAVTYRIGRLLHEFGKRVVNINSITLPNLMSERNLYPEMISVGPIEPAVDFLTESIDAMLGDEFYFRRLKADLAELRNRVALPGATKRAAEFLSEQITSDVRSGDQTHQFGDAVGTVGSVTERSRRVPASDRRAA